MSGNLIITVVGFHTLVVAIPAAMLVAYFRPALLGWCMALFLGLLTGFINLMSDEVQFPVMLLLAFGFFMGYQIRRHLLWLPVILAVWVPAGQFIRLAVTPHAGTIAGDGIASFAAFVPAAIGTVVGWALRRYGKPNSPEGATGDDINNREEGSTV